MLLTSDYSYNKWHTLEYLVQCPLSYDLCVAVLHICMDALDCCTAEFFQPVINSIRVLMPIALLPRSSTSRSSLDNKSNADIGTGSNSVNITELDGIYKSLWVAYNDLKSIHLTNITNMMSCLSVVLVCIAYVHARVFCIFLLTVLVHIPLCCAIYMRRCLSPAYLLSRLYTQTLVRFVFCFVSCYSMQQHTQDLCTVSVHMLQHCLPNLHILQWYTLHYVSGCRRVCLCALTFHLAHSVLCLCVYVCVCV